MVRHFERFGQMLKEMGNLDEGQMSNSQLCSMFFLLQKEQVLVVNLKFSQNDASLDL